MMIFYLLPFIGIVAVSCSPGASVPETTVSPTVQPSVPAAPPNLTGDLSMVIVDLEECVQNLGENTGRDHKEKGIVLGLARDEYIEFLKKDMYAYRSGGYAAASDPVCLKCSIRILDYLNQMSQEKKQWLADLYMEAYRRGYEGK